MAQYLNCCPYLGEQVGEEERTVPGAVGGWHLRIKPAPPLGFLARHNRPTDGLGIFEDPGLHGFVFSGNRQYSTYWFANE